MKTTMAESSAQQEETEPLKFSFQIDGKEFETYVFKTKLVFNCNKDAKLVKRWVDYAWKESYRESKYL